MRKLTIRLQEDQLSFIQGLLKKQAAEECKNTNSYDDVCSAVFVMEALNATFNTTEYKK